MTRQVSRTVEELRKEPAFREIVDRLRDISEERQQEILEEIDSQTNIQGDDHD